MIAYNALIISGINISEDMNAPLNTTVRLMVMKQFPIGVLYPIHLKMVISIYWWNVIKFYFFKKNNPDLASFRIQKKLSSKEQKDWIEENFNEGMRTAKGILFGLFFSTAIWITILCAIWLL